MAKKRYKFNPQTLTYEVIAIPLRIRFYRILRKILVGFILASIANLLFSFFFYTPKMYRISERNNELMLQYEMLGDKIRAATAKLDELRHRDNRVYRSLFGVDSLSVHGVYTPYPAAKYGSMKDDPYAPQMIGTWLELDRMTRLLYQESKSLDQLEVMAKSKELMADAIPAIWPIDRRNLRGHIGAFGSRVHPISGRISGHQGIDLGGRTGNPVYATGDGTVAFNNDRPRLRLEDPLRAPEQDTRLSGTESQARRADRRGRQHRTLDRTAPALRGNLPGPARRPDQLLQPRYDRGRIRKDHRVGTGDHL